MSSSKVETVADSTPTPNFAPPTRESAAEKAKAKKDKAKTDKPKTDKPKKDKPKTDKPKTDKPKTDKPKTDKPKKDKPKKDKTKYTARTADKYLLYQKSVQAPDADIEFIDQVFEEFYERKPKTLREDFCGAAAMACEWVRTRPENKAWGVDLDPEPLDWGRKNNLTELNDEQLGRLELIQGDVREARKPLVDVVAAQNFSFCIFKKRSELLSYFKTARQGLAKDGIFVLDIFGGPDSQEPAQDQTKHKGFTYIWDQQYYDAINNYIKCAIHFKFKDGTKLKNAFTYDWRLWTIAELKELLEEAGFSKANAYWEGADEEGEGNGVFTFQKSAENEDAWIAYVVGIN